MTEANSKIDVETVIDKHVDSEPNIYKKAMINPHVPLEHYERSGFTNPIFIFDNKSPKYNCEYDLQEYDIIDVDMQATRGEIAYEDILLQKMMAIYDDKREEFITYQAQLYEDQKKWLEELRRFWIGFRKYIVDLEDREFYDEYLAIIDKVSKRKMKKAIEFGWNGKQISLVKLAIALYESGVIEINKDAYSVSKFIEAFAHAMNFEMDNITANNYKSKIISKVTKGTIDDKDLDIFNELEEKFSIWLEKERMK